MSAAAPVPAAADGALVAEDVVVALGGRRVLDGVSLVVRPGELVALIGPNGAGKSTLLQVLAGDVAPASGQVLLDGEDLARRRPRELARRRAVMPQEHRVAFPFAVRRVVEMGRTPWRGVATPAQDDGAVGDALALAGLTALANRPVTAVSGGERARTAFARTAAQRCALVLLDEPTAALDVRHQQAVLTHLGELARGGHAVVVVLHDLSLAAAAADRVVVLAGGRVRADGPPADVLVPAVLTEVYEHPVDVITHPRTGQLLVVPLPRPPHPGPASPDPPDAPRRTA